MQTRISRLTVMRSYFLLSALCSIIAAVLLLMAVGKTENANLFGISGAWLGLVLLLVVVSACLLFFTINIFRKSAGPNLLISIQERLDKGSWRKALLFTGLFLYCVGSIFLLSSSPIIYGPTYPLWLVPFFAWLVGFSLLTLVHLALFRVDTALGNVFRLVLLLVILTFGILVNLQFWSYDSPRQEDIYFTYLDGERLLEGVNPYERVLTGDMRVNDKYSTYFPIFYYLSWVTQRLGLNAFADWLSFWRVVFLVANLSIAALLFYVPDQQRLLALSVFASLFWLFNRWTLHVAKTADIDFLALFLMLLSLFLYQRHAKASYLILGLSLGVKQMAIFLVPLYLIWAWEESSPFRRAKDLLLAVALIGIIPLIASIPFLAWNWDGFFRSILFSATRDAVAAFEVYSLDAVLGLQGIRAKAPLLIMLAAVYWLTWKHKIYLYTPALLAMAVFVFFNSVIFTSYMIWVVALIPLVACEYLQAGRMKVVRKLS